ncbi:hypothetical protein LTR96_011029 [Exophiala xenobiotica]|nr:hypothetical protein H2202_010877 [Exophiala xenobiotica]KAK5188986.1 hypothetical protein LTR92_011003 [Exophiala xenobiotica]KAK5215987.1 hypothetical protein LTR72_010961 [Exophiala xenobiotica]KAK5263598.1 hypothetical protein LTR96_011029 [Exophiala xenobiotica]KAK5285347.1 hypothetical protein LTR14_011040 [Exophiala xenobiotica]
MVDTQRSLILGGTTIPEVQRWLDSGGNWINQGSTIDPFFGCSVRLPRLLSQAARLSDELQKSPPQRTLSDDEVRRRANNLQQQVAETAIELTAEPQLAVSCHSEAIHLHPIVDINQHEYFRRLVAVAELFRHAAHIYIHRITHGPEEPLTPDMLKSVESMIDLLTKVPDALGPGSNLGWCLTVLGAEIDAAEHREYIKTRLQCIRILGLDNPSSAEKVLEEVWAQRDARRRDGRILQRWHEVMRHMGQGQILI